MGELCQKALIADDDEYFRIALRSILSQRLGLPEVVETSSFDAALERMVETPDLDLALFDLAMPGMDSPGNLRTVRELFPQTRVAVVSASSRRSDILTALEAGAHGYVPKGLSVEELTRAIEAIIRGTIYVPASLAQIPQTAANAAPAENGAADPPAGAPAATRLTPRQRDVLKLLVEGRSNKEMARMLDLGEGTIKIHMAALFRNLGAQNRAAAAVIGARLLARMGADEGSPD